MGALEGFERRRVWSDRCPDRSALAAGWGEE
jgi:hypothetical protein